MKKIMAITAILVVLMLVPALAAADWPQAKHDAGHSSASDSAIVPPLGVQWQESLGDHIVSSPVVSNGTLFVANDDENTLLALDPLTGSRLWSFTADGAIESTPAVANGSVVVGSYDGYLYRLDAS